MTFVSTDKHFEKVCEFRLVVFLCPKSLHLNHHIVLVQILLDLQSCRVGNNKDTFPTNRKIVLSTINVIAMCVLAQDLNGKL